MFFWENKKVLITGHTGFKGTWLSLMLKHLKADVYGYSLSPNTSPALYNVLGVDELIHSQINDINNYNNFHDFLNHVSPDIVFHMAAQPLVRYSYTAPIETYMTNVMGTAHVLEAVRNNKNVKSTVIITTDKCYENKEQIWPYREIDRLGGHDPYSNSKACAELLVSSYVKSFFIDNHIGSVATVRAGNVVGGGDWSLDRLVPDLIRSLHENKSPEIRSPFAIRPWQHVLEPLSGYMLAAKLLYGQNQKQLYAWNFGPQSDNERNVEFIANNICDFWGRGRKPIIQKTDQLHEANFLSLDSKKAKNELNWFPKWGIGETLQRTVDWYKTFYAGENIKDYTLNQIDDYYKGEK
jgi:CDP-glucose 4,6-dehydratase